jgi:hypothetical protein
MPCGACGQPVHTAASFRSFFTFALLNIVGLVVGGFILGPVGFFIGIIVGAAVGAVALVRGSTVVASNPVHTRRWRIAAAIVVMFWLGFHVWQYLSS